MKMTRLILICLLLIYACNPSSDKTTELAKQGFEISEADLLMYEESSVIDKANEILQQEPAPITMFVSERSMGGVHDFYSEGDYWWPDPENPSGPYIRKDGLSNPENFLSHRIAMRNLNEWVATLVAAYKVTKDEKYASHAIKHLNAFFVDPATLMNPSLLYAQAIQGRHTGRGIGIIDTIHLIEVAKSILELKEMEYLSEATFAPYRQWFDQYATWMNTHQYGVDEKFHGNNHSTWWAAQIAAFAEIADRDDLKKVAADQFKSLLASQMEADGSFPDELERTKPYSYSLFNLEGYAILCHLASSSDEDLWTYEGPNGSIKKAFDFMMPYIKDKSNWIKPPDVEHFDEVPIQSVGILLAAQAYESEEYLKTWKLLDAEKKSEEVKRTFPLWYPINWI
jgi:hypothetical protein